MSACHVCRRTGIRTCDPEEAEVMCALCQFCERDAIRQQFEEKQRP